MTPLVMICATLAMHDVDSGRCDGTPVRLAGIDGGEMAGSSRCRDRPNVWACTPVVRATAIEARDRARQLTANGARCTDTGQRSWRRIVARCTVNGRDLGAILVSEGLAISETNFNDPYRREEDAARRGRRGVWR